MALIAVGLVAWLLAAPPTVLRAGTVDAAATPGAVGRAIAPYGPAQSAASAGSAAPAGPASAPPRASRSSRAARPSAAAGTSAAARASAADSAPVAVQAGRIEPGVSYHGVATSYAAGDGNGACLFGPSSDMMIAAMNYTDYQSARACGAYVQVRAANGASITVRITNECPLPCAPGQLDLSAQAFAALAKPSLGRIPITWRLVSPAVAGPLAIRYKAGSSQWWCGIQVLGHRNPVVLLEVRAHGSWRRLPRADYNYFISADGSGCGGAIRVTDVYGQRLVLPGLPVRPDVVQRVGGQFVRH